MPPQAPLEKGVILTVPREFSTIYLHANLVVGETRIVVALCEVALRNRLVPLRHLEAHTSRCWGGKSRVDAREAESDERREGRSWEVHCELRVPWFVVVCWSYSTWGTLESNRSSFYIVSEAQVLAPKMEWNNTDEYDAYASCRDDWLADRSAPTIFLIYSRCFRRVSMSGQALYHIVSYSKFRSWKCLYHVGHGTFRPCRTSGPLSALGKSRGRFRGQRIANISCRRTGEDESTQESLQTSKLPA